MKKRTTESDHFFIKELYNSIHAFSVEGLTMDDTRDFIAIVEAVEFEKNESIDLLKAFTKEEVLAKKLLADELSIPLYFVCYKHNFFYVYSLKEEKIDSYDFFSEVFIEKNKYDRLGFISWWKSIKKTSQSHPLNNGAATRTARTVFDEVIESSGYAWGGNVDAFIVNSNFTKILCIVDDISIGFVSITDYRADPGLFFHKRGPIYNTWFSTVKLASNLQVPHILLTKNANDKKAEIVGISVIDYLDKSGIHYVHNQKPPENIIRGKSNIIETLRKLILTSLPPKYR